MAAGRGDWTRLRVRFFLLFFAPLTQIVELITSANLSSKHGERLGVLKGELPVRVSESTNHSQLLY